MEALRLRLLRGAEVDDVDDEGAGKQAAMLNRLKLLKELHEDGKA